MKTNFLHSFIIILLVIGGCWGSKKNPTNQPELNTREDVIKAKEIILKSSTAISDATEDITKAATTIGEETREVQRKVPDEVKVNIDPHLNTIQKSSNTILDDTTKINKATAELSGSTSLLTNAEQKLTVIENSLETITKERDEALAAQKKAEDDRDQAIRSTLKWLTIACVIGAGILGVFGFMYQSKMSLTLSAMCIVVMTISIFVEAYFIYVSIAGGIILALLVGMLIYNIIIQKKALTETINTVEIAQDKLSEEERKKIFGGDGENGIMNKVQSKTTMDIVKKEKEQMSSLWNYAKENKKQ